MYDYKKERASIFSEKGQRLFLAIRDQVKNQIETSGAVTMEKASSLPSGIGCASNFDMMACVDRLAELGEIKEVTGTGEGYSRVFISNAYRGR